MWWGPRLVPSHPCLFPPTLELLTILFVKSVYQGQSCPIMPPHSPWTKASSPFFRRGACSSERAVFTSDPALLGFPHSLMLCDGFLWPMEVVQPWTSPSVIQWPERGPVSSYLVGSSLNKIPPPIPAENLLNKSLLHPQQACPSLFASARSWVPKNAVQERNGLTV